MKCWDLQKNKWLAVKMIRKIHSKKSKSMLMIRVTVSIMLYFQDNLHFIVNSNKRSKVLRYMQKFQNDIRYSQFIFSLIHTKQQNSKTVQNCLMQWGQFIRKSIEQFFRCVFFSQLGSLFCTQNFIVLSGAARFSVVFFAHFSLWTFFYTLYRFDFISFVLPHISLFSSWFSHRNTFAVLSQNIVSV